jgi:hypothetical protein
MSDIHALFVVAFPLSLSEGEVITPEGMKEFFYSALDNGYELPLPVYLTGLDLVKLDAFIEEHNLGEKDIPADMYGM